MSLYGSFKTSPKLEAEGIWLDYGFMKIRVARAGGSNQKYNAAVASLFKNYKRAIEVEALSNDKARALLVDVYAETVVLDWQTRTGGDEANPEYTQGIEAPNGEILPFTKENVVTTLNNLPELFVDIKKDAEGIQLFRQSLLDDAAKN